MSVIIPACNEAERLPAVLPSFLETFRPGQGFDDAEIIVVVNGSTDRTADRVREAALGHPHLRLIEEPAPIGKGAAVRLGIGHSRFDPVGFVDADGATSAAEFRRLLDLLGPGVDAVIGSRRMPGSVVDPPPPLPRRLGSRAFNLLVRLLFGFPFRDTQCGAKWVRREVLVPAAGRMGITRWAFDVDLLFQLRRLGAVIREAPTVWRERPGTHVRYARATWDMFVAVIRLRLLFSPLRFCVRLYDRTLGPWVHRA